MAVVLGRTLWHFAKQFQLGQSAPDGGNTICRNGGIIWIVAPNTSEVSRTWHCRDDAVTTATACTTATGWFVPTCGQLQNPGYTCRTYWDSYTPSFYWSSTENVNTAIYVNLVNGFTGVNGNKTNTLYVRAFRCVTY